MTWTAEHLTLFSPDSWIVQVLFWNPVQSRTANVKQKVFSVIKYHGLHGHKSSFDLSRDKGGPHESRKREEAAVINGCCWRDCMMMVFRNKTITKKVSDRLTVTSCFSKILINCWAKWLKNYQEKNGIGWIEYRRQMVHIITFQILPPPLPKLPMGSWLEGFSFKKKIGRHFIWYGLLESQNLPSHFSNYSFHLLSTRGRKTRWLTHHQTIWSGNKASEEQKETVERGKIACSTADGFFLFFHRGHLYVIPSQRQQEVGKKKKLLKVTSAGGTIAEIGFISLLLVNQQQK